MYLCCDLIRVGCILREWRQAGGYQALSTSHPINDVSSPTPASRKKQRTTQSLPTNVPPPSAGALGGRGRKPRQVEDLTCISISSDAGGLLSFI